MEFSQEQNLSEENVQGKPNTEDVELNEDQLEAVAGGAKGTIEFVGIINPISKPDLPPCTTNPIDPSVCFGS